MAPTIRPIRAADFPLLQAFVRGLSRATGYRRLMSGRTPGDDEIRRWADIDGRREGALVATGEDGAIVGVARYVMESEDAAEVAIVLADAWQGRGLGRQLLALLIEAARRRGIRVLAGTTLTDNRAMLALARRLGFSARRVPGAAFATQLRLELAPA